MDQNLQLFFRTEICKDWLSIKEGGKPETFWVAEHESVNEVDNYISTPVVACWYFDGVKFHTKLPSDFAAFMNLAAGHPYGTKTYEIGYGGYASLNSSIDDIVLYWQFGGLFGTGYLYFRDAEGVFKRKKTWKS